ncbi:hypothetical protein KKD37_01670 [Patescibacteria group bacterium]|nr:hypothetical protein [Patescibacteria group bacterium]
MSKEYSTVKQILKRNSRALQASVPETRLDPVETAKRENRNSAERKIIWDLFEKLIHNGDVRMSDEPYVEVEVGKKHYQGRCNLGWIIDYYKVKKYIRYTPARRVEGCTDDGKGVFVELYFNQRDGSDCKGVRCCALRVETENMRSRLVKTLPNGEKKYTRITTDNVASVIGGALTDPSPMIVNIKKWDHRNYSYPFQVKDRGKTSWVGGPSELSWIRGIPKNIKRKLL